MSTKRDWVQALHDKLREAVCNTPQDVPERKALDAALDIAEEWRTRLSELEAEEDDDEN